jgi:hypothetical protein
MSIFFERWWKQLIAEARAAALLDKSINVIEPREQEPFIDEEFRRLHDRRSASDRRA